MDQATSPAYVIPDIQSDISKRAKLGLLMPLCILAGIAYAFYCEGFKTKGMDHALRMVIEGAMLGAMFGGLIAVALFVPVALVLQFRQKAVWAEHTYDWYRAAFPAHAHAKGRISCRHCGSEHIRAERMMNHTFMRTHSCGQCGKTLYFSPEQR